MTTEIRTADKTSIRVRFAPSPTGTLHIGGARTAYFNWLFARQNQGKVILRIDDTDTSRSTEASYRQILDSFAWLGLDFDESPEVGGAYGPYRQSQRTEIYQAYLRKLQEEGLTYPCFCTPEELQKEREAAQKEGRAPRYSGRCRHLAPEEAARRIEAGERAVFRLKTDVHGETTVHDLIRGDVTFQNEEIDDFIIWKADGTPTYHFASCVDDVEMRITHIIRAEEHLSNTPRHIQLFQAFHAEIPVFAHVPMILAPDRSKLSKRHGATSVEEYREAGILPEALVNYLLLLGFSPGENREIVSREEAIECFRLERVAKHAAVYDVKKLEWLNQYYFRTRSVDQLLYEMWPGLLEKAWVSTEESREKLAWLRTLLQFLQQKSRQEADVWNMLECYFRPPVSYDDKGVKKHFQHPETAQRLRQLADLLATLPVFAAWPLEQLYRQTSEQIGCKAADLIHPTRLALTGITVGPGLFDVMTLLGRKECHNRLLEAANFIEKSN